MALAHRLRALDSCASRIVCRFMCNSVSAERASPAVFRGASLTGKSIKQLKTFTETRCDACSQLCHHNHHTTLTTLRCDLAGWLSRATRCPRRWSITTIRSFYSTDPSNRSRPMLAECGPRSWGRLVGEGDACGILCLVGDDRSDLSPDLSWRFHASCTRPCRHTP